MFEGENTTTCSMEKDASSVSSNKSGLQSKASYDSSNCPLIDATHEPFHVVGNDFDSKETSYSSIDGSYLSTDRMTTSTRDNSFESRANSSSDDAIAAKSRKYASNTQRDSDDVTCPQQNSFFDSIGETSSPSMTPQSSFGPDLAFYEIEQIFDEMNEIIKDTAEIIHAPFSTSRKLLNHFKWDKDSLTSKYFDSLAEDFYRECNVVNPDSLSDIFKEDTSDECRICLKTSKTIDGMLTGASCGHKFCNICWDQYLSSKITDDGLAETISCAEYKCSIIVEDTFVTSMLTDPAIKLMYRKLLANNFIQLKQDWFWCPSPKCNFAIQKLSIVADPICQCGVSFCDKCFEDCHDPVECRHLKIWKSDESATQVYLAAKTKDCPKCRAPIEKNGGCNHMTCSRCPHQFCWICLDDWNLHNSSYNCNRYKKTAKAKNEKFKHFWNRYCEHRRSLKFEEELSDKVTKANESINAKKSAKEIECFQKGFTALLKCRRMLMNSYVFVYYLKDDGENNEASSKDIFETNQADLEAAAERLSGLLQDHCKGDANEELMDKICSNIIDKYGYCNRRRDTLLTHAREGMWSYTH